MMRSDDATRAQVRAADPAASTWVSANAGSGKTRVLIDRVSRLLYRGNDPGKILCLTYTNAAAAEMQNRLFERLGGWAMMPDAALLDALRTLGEIRDGDEATPEALRRARRLFANALETPGGLKIQTIHAFCDALLRRFPLEAKTSRQFEIMDDRRALQLRQDVFDTLADGTASSTVDRLLRSFTGADPDALVQEIVGNREAFEQGFPKALLPEPPSVESVLGTLLSDSAIDLLKGWAGTLKSDKAAKATDRRNGERLLSAVAAGPTAAGLQILEGVMLFGKGARLPFEPKLGTFPTKALRTAYPDRTRELDVLMEAVAKARKVRIDRLCYERTRALHDFAAVFLREFDRRKRLRSDMNFDDLIRMTCRLLSDPGIADWIRYRLDGGIDHILIDEAQDTSRRQWDIVQRLEEEFTVGEGVRPGNRTLFVVGDEKQSIFSFQGADPDHFGDVQSYFADRYAQAGGRLQERNLRYSFRSAPAILALTDQVCHAATMIGGPEAATGSGNPASRRERVLHRAFEPDKPGRVDLWEFLEEEGRDDWPEWFQPASVASGRTDVRILLARLLADHLQDILRSPPRMPRTIERRMAAGDILILVQTRSVLFDAIIRELKSRNLPVAGADRMEVGAELAVRDILSLLRFAATPRDDLSLAEALRSPLIGISEEQLFDLAHDRRGSLWSAIRSSGERHSEALTILADCEALSSRFRPHELIERILDRHDGRRRLLARLGPEAEDGIDELVSQALLYETAEPPTLTGFLNWFDLGTIDVKRRNQSDMNQIRVMTVHGAKGLEAPFVILPDTGLRRPGLSGETLTLEDGSIIWRSTGDDATEVQRDAEDRLRASGERERNRLLYVALTRAIHWLLVCGAGKRGAKDDDTPCWYDRIETAMAALDAETKTFAGGRPGLRLGSGNWPADSDSSSSSAPCPTIASRTGAIGAAPGQDWLHEPVSADPPAPPPVPASALGGAKAIRSGPAGDDTAENGPGAERSREKAMAFGERVHSLLEHLPQFPPASWPAVADRLGHRRGWGGEAEVGPALTMAESVLLEPGLQALFQPDTLAEVPVTAPLDSESGRRMIGVIDRLVVCESRVLAVDYKTNAHVPVSAEETPDGILRQMGAYAAALRQIYPDCAVDVAILWTTTGSYMPLPKTLVAERYRAAVSEEVHSKATQQADI